MNSSGSTGIGNLRRAARKNISDPIPVENVISEKMLGRIGNLSLSGLMLICSERLCRDAIYQIRFALPDGHDGETVPMEVGVHEQWTEQTIGPGQFWSGMRIIDISTEDEARLARWLERT
ncbi:MAG TPA: PilZ domain-containing protein [Rhodanobacteraceae bacterium]|nr:PilZ domain-containing protein [Rhodanobacteraceae bacterium]